MRPKQDEWLAGFCVILSVNVLGVRSMGFELLYLSQGRGLKSSVHLRDLPLPDAAECDKSFFILAKRFKFRKTRA